MAKATSLMCPVMRCGSSDKGQWKMFKVKSLAVKRKTLKSYLESSFACFTKVGLGVNVICLGPPS